MTGPGIYFVNKFENSIANWGLPYYNQSLNCYKNLEVL
jgi:hypothetical protein